MSKVYPVIHYLSHDLSIEQAILAHSLGADGVFLIAHNDSNEKLIPVAKKLKDMFSDFEIGLNFLGDPVIETALVAKEHGLDMVWGDYCGVSSQGLTMEGEILQQWFKENEKIKLFASVAFKYQKEEINPPLAAKEAANAGFIPTTSGTGTGSAPSVDKIMSMSNVTNGLLAVASGMTCENIVEFKPYLSHILVATGVSKDDHHFDVDKLAQFIQLVKNK